jgi:hypothetical protein
MLAIQQTVDIPASHRLTIDVPREVPAGVTILTFTPKDAAGAAAKKARADRDIEIINRNAEELNRESADMHEFLGLDL